MSRLRRLPHSKATRLKISAALREHTVSEETREKISAALTGRKHTPEAIAKMTAARRARPLLTTESVIAAARVATYARHKRNNALRIAQWREDLGAAWKLGDKQLWADVRKSWGWGYARRRRSRDRFPHVSNGFFFKKGSALGFISWESRPTKLDILSKYKLPRLYRYGKRQVDGQRRNRPRARAPRRIPEVL